MGSGIAQVAANSGMRVTLVDVSEAALDRGLASIKAGLSRLQKKGTSSAEDSGSALARISVSTSAADLAGAGLVVEAATEQLET